MALDVLCIGQVCLDMIIAGVDLEEFASAAREFTLAKKGVFLSTGGDAANEAVVLRRLGKRSGIAGEVKNDAVGRLVRDMLIGERVDTTFLAVTERENTESAPNLVFVLPDAQRKFLCADIGPSRLKRLPFDESIVETVKVLSLASIGAEPLAGEEGVEWIKRIAKRAKKAGAIVCADVMNTQWRADPRVYPELYAAIDYLFPNDHEAMALCGAGTVEEAADVFLAAGLGAIVIKTGKKGCFVKTRDGEGFHAPTYTALQAVDTTGAGDNFAAGFICGLLEEKGLRECCMLGHAAASISVTGYGASTKVKSRAQVDDVMEKYDPERN